MRVGFNGFGQLGVYSASASGLRGLGDCVFDANTETQVCTDPGTDPQSGETYGTTGSGTTGSGTGSSGSGVDPQSGETYGPGTYKTPSDNEYVTGCSSYDSYGNCVTCGSGYKLNTYGGAYTSCDSVGGLPGVKKPVASPSAFTSILNSIFGGASAPKGPTPTSASACAAAGGTWTGTTCTPKGTINLGGVALSTGTLVIGGIFLLLMMKKK